jgi:hypothetical protein
MICRFEYDTSTLYQDTACLVSQSQWYVDLSKLKTVAELETFWSLDDFHYAKKNIASKL